ncbi:MAG TPA: phosphate ABC transporter substrate-binding protein PstS [Kofleriaceae bacterium]|nr:phosphate ABC transporter substrate-binding protein PstS [Kofleriaceae bacterium]
MKTWIAILASSTTLFATSCKKGEDSGSAKMTEGSNKAKEAPSGPVTINGSGSTFQKQFQEVAIDAFSKDHANIKVNYGAGGSGKGRQDFSDQVTDYGCSDGLYKDDAEKKTKGGAFIYVPVLLGAITVSYNVDGVDKLQLSAETIAKIFQREIKKWNDPAIAADNPGVKLPATNITVAHRSDGSGTTEQFTKYLDIATNSTAWHLKSGATVEWAPDTQAGNGNSGVAQIVKNTSGAIGYVDLPDAKASGLKFAAIKNLAGKYIAPSSESASAAGDGIDVKDNLTFVSVNAKGDASYPITAPSWCMAYVKQTDKAKGEAVKTYFKYMVTDGQKLIPSIDFAALPKTLQDKAVAAVDKIQTP